MNISDEMLDGLIGNAKTQDDLFGSGGIIKELSRRLMERMLEAEMTHQLSIQTLTHKQATIDIECFSSNELVFNQKFNG